MTAFDFVYLSLAIILSVIVMYLSSVVFIASLLGLGWSTVAATILGVMEGFAFTSIMETPIRMVSGFVSYTAVKTTRAIKDKWSDFSANRFNKQFGIVKCN